MAEDTAVKQPPLSGRLMFYDNPEPLNKIVHAGLGLKKVDKAYSFVSDANIVPLMVNEFGPAAMSYPIIFAGSPRRPAVVLALADGQNLFVDPDKGFKPDAYVPLYVRRYPFALANDHTNQKLVLVIDRDSRLISDKPDLPFFEKGEPTKLVEDTVNFCNDFEQARMMTDSFCAQLEELDLFEVRTSEFTPKNPDGTEGEKQTIAEYFAVDEKKLADLPADKLAELRASGALQQIYAHLISQHGWDKLLALHFARAGEYPVAGAA